MKYEVLDDFNICVTVTDEGIISSIEAGKYDKCEIVMAMGMTHKIEYLPYLYQLLNHNNPHIRFEAAKSIFTIDGQLGLDKLKEREIQIDESNFSTEPSEKALLQALIIRIEKGIKGVEEYFLSEDGYEIVKYMTIAYYTKGYRYQEMDIELTINTLDIFIEKKTKWIAALPKDAYIEFIVCSIDNIWYANNGSELLKHINDSLCDKICKVFGKVTQIKIDSDTLKTMDSDLLKAIGPDALEAIADISLGMRKEYAVALLKSLKGKVRGCAKKAYMKALKKWELDEEKL